MKEYTDTERMDFIAAALDNAKWHDTLPMFRPRNVMGDNTEKYVSRATFREAIDYCLKRGMNQNY